MKTTYLPLLCVVVLTTNSFADDELTVAVSEIRPCAIYEGESMKGFCVDLWQMCAKEMGIKTRFLRVPFNEKLAKVRNHEADVAIAGISITESRERDVDFSLPTLNSGLRILVRNDGGVMPNLSARTWRVVLGFLVFLTLFGHVLWLLERGGNEIHAGYIPGIFEAFWCVVVTMSTVGYGDVVPRKWTGRLLTAVIMLVGIGLFGLTFAALTADILEQRKSSDICSYHDLACLKTATKVGTTSSDFLHEQGFSVQETQTFEEACELLRRGEVDAVVYDDPSIRYMAAQHPEFVIAGEVFRPQYYGFAFPQDSPLIETFNHVLLRLKESGQYDRLYQRWFGMEGRLPA